LTLPINDVEVSELAERLKLNQKKKAMMLHFRSTYHDILKKIETTKKNSEIFQILCSLEEEELIVLTAMASEMDQNKIKKYYKELRYIKLSLNGFEIAERSFLNKEKLGMLIHELLMMKLDGFLPTKEEEEKQIMYLSERINHENQMEH
jgi:hypothetical protein